MRAVWGGNSPVERYMWPAILSVQKSLPLEWLGRLVMCYRPMCRIWYRYCSLPSGAMYPAPPFSFLFPLSRPFKFHDKGTRLYVACTVHCTSCSGCGDTAQCERWNWNENFVPSSRGFRLPPLSSWGLLSSGLFALSSPTNVSLTDRAVPFLAAAHISEVITWVSLQRQCDVTCPQQLIRQCAITDVEASWNVMAHAQKPDFVFRRNGRVPLNRRGRHFSRLLAGEMCASGVVMLDTPCSEVVWRVLATPSIRQFPLHIPFRASPCAITFQLESTERGILPRIMMLCHEWCRGCAVGTRDSLYLFDALAAYVGCRDQDAAIWLTLQVCGPGSNSEAGHLMSFKKLACLVT